MRTLLICHEDAALDREGLVRWLASFTTVAGVLVIREPGRRLRTRIRREVSRVGPLRFADVLAFRVFYAAAFARRDRQWAAARLEELRRRFPLHPAPPELTVASPNAPDAERFIRACAPDLAIARCKSILRPAVFEIPRLGTFVMHPGICPEYRNAHGCFWAMATGDRSNVGMTLLRVDRGVDTGPVFGYFRVTPDAGESHVAIQHRVVLDHLDGIRDRLLAIEAGAAQPIDTSGRRSAAWGQPWLSAWLRTRIGRPLPAGRGGTASPAARVEPAGLPR